ncbi:type II toxin-antitoxin system prevent-host-death family antitoxin [Clostridium sp. BJN0013]|uniref:type II toxin-antitoxin system prevent-host-death family antitoxin n=1 Tax=Clostridium sp. BJN0013 TaxID=3236840 RepID=UPI0034C66A96
MIVNLYLYTDLQRNTSRVLDTDKEIFIMKNNHPFKVITSVEEYNKQIDAFENLNDKLLEAEKRLNDEI